MSFASFVEGASFLYMPKPYPAWFWSRLRLKGRGLDVQFSHDSKIHQDPIS